MQLKLVDSMEHQPGYCALCHGNPPGDDQQPQSAVHAEGVDWDWGNHVYICMECANIIADLIGREDQHTHRKLLNDFHELEQRYEKLLADYEAQNERVAKMVEGKKALNTERKRQTKKVRG